MTIPASQTWLKFSNYSCIPNMAKSLKGWMICTTTWSRITWSSRITTPPFSPHHSLYLQIIVVCSCGRNESFPNHVLFVLGMGRRANATLTNLFNPTSGRDASHPCLINTWPKEGCTIVCVMRASLKNCACTHYALLRLGPALWIRRGKVGVSP